MPTYDLIMVTAKVHVFRTVPRESNLRVFGVLGRSRLNWPPLRDFLEAMRRTLLRVGAGEGYDRLPEFWELLATNTASTGLKPHPANSDPVPDGWSVNEHTTLVAEPVTQSDGYLAYHQSGNGDYWRVVGVVHILSNVDGVTLTNQTRVDPVP